MSYCKRWDPREEDDRKVDSYVGLFGSIIENFRLRSHLEALSTRFFYVYAVKDRDIAAV